MKTWSIQGNFYNFIIVDDHTHYKWTLFLLHKSNAFEAFKKFHALITTYYKGMLRATRSDCGGEFLLKDFIQYMEKHGVHHQLTAPHTPQQNGIAERANPTIAEAAWAMMQSAGMSQAFWEFAVTTAVHVRNHAPSHVTGNISPHEWLIKQPPDLSYLHIFGCLAYAHTTTQRSKFDPTSQRLFIGYDNSTKGYKLWNPSSHKIVITTDVMFEEYIFPLHTLKPLNTQLSSVPEHLPLLPPKLVDLALPESDNEDDDAPQPLLAPPKPPPTDPVLPS